MQQSTADPITSVCVVADANKCPPSYEVLLKSSDKKDDCDLWKDGVFKSKVVRYLCFSRVDQNKSGPKEVLVDLAIQNDKEPPRTGFQLIDKTLDTREKATNKKCISVKMLPIGATTDAISDIILLSKSKRATAGYTAVGDVNGLVLCFKMSKVTKAGIPTPKPSGVKIESSSERPKSVPASPVAQTTNSSVRKSITGPNPLFDVPFHLNPKFADETSLKNIQSVPQVSYKSLADIDKEYSYIFNLERSTISQTRP